MLLLCQKPWQYVKPYLEKQSMRLIISSVLHWPGKGKSLMWTGKYFLYPKTDVLESLWGDFWMTGFFCLLVSLKEHAAIAEDPDSYPVSAVTVGKTVPLNFKCNTDHTQDFTATMTIKLWRVQHMNKDILWTFFSALSGLPMFWLRGWRFSLCRGGQITIFWRLSWAFYTHPAGMENSFG